jgi:hypothetical protein
MKRFRVHLGTLVILVLLLGIGFAALRESNETWDSITFSITLCVLLISILLAVYRTEKRRAFWLGFALFGWIYLGLSLLPSIESRLITTKALHFLDSKVPRSIQGSDPFDAIEMADNSKPFSIPVNKGNGDLWEGTVVTGSSTPWLTYSLARPTMTGSSSTTENFVRIGQSLLTLLAGWFGGQLSRRLCRDSRHPEVSSVVEAGGSPR